MSAMISCQCGETLIASGFCKNDKHLTTADVDKLNGRNYCVKRDDKTGEIREASCFVNGIGDRYYIAECLDGRKFKFYRKRDVCDDCENYHNTAHCYCASNEQFNACKLCSGNPSAEIVNPYCYIGEDLEQECSDFVSVDTEGEWLAGDKPPNDSDSKD